MSVTLKSNLLSQSICLKEAILCVLILQLDVHQACTVMKLLAANNAQKLVVVGQGNVGVRVLMALHGIAVGIYIKLGY